MLTTMAGASQGGAEEFFMRLARALSPIASIALAGGPTKISPALVAFFAKAAFSDRKP